MRLIDRRAAVRRGYACMLAIAFCLAPVISGVRAQETPTGGPAAIASAGEPVLLREQPGYDAAVLATLGDGNPLDVAGEPVTAADGTHMASGGRRWAERLRPGGVRRGRLHGGGICCCARAYT